MTEDASSYGTTPETSPDTTFEAQYKRVFDAAECRTQTQLADILEIRQSSISDSKKRKSIPSDWLVKLLERKRVNPEWVRTGVGPMRLGSTGDQTSMPHVVKITEVRPPAECSSQELFTELVRRALEPFDFEEMQKQASAARLPVKKGES